MMALRCQFVWGEMSDARVAGSNGGSNAWLVIFTERRAQSKKLSSSRGAIVLGFAASKVRVFGELALALGCSEEWPIFSLDSKSIRRLSLVVVSVAFVVCLIELPALTQLIDYRTIIGPEHAWWAPNVTDPELLHVHRPRAHQSGSAQGGDAAAAYEIPVSDRTLFRWDVTYDHNGFRNDVDLSRADTIVVGDSFVEGLTVPTAELTTSRLAHLRSEVVANLGQSAYGPLEEFVVLKRYGLPLRPRTVVWMFFEGNDLGDVLAYRHAMRNPRSFWRSFWARSFTRNALKEVKRHFVVSSKLSGVKRSAVFEPSSGKKVTLYFIYPSGPLSSDDLSAFDETTRIIAAAHSLCAAQGARLIFVFVPTKFRVFRPFCRFPQESECRNWVLNDLPERFQRAVESISPDIGYLDLTPKLTDAAATGVLPYYPDDAHWSPDGHRIAAEAINEYLLATQKP